MAPCNTCARRKLCCDLLKPRCSPCRRSHLKCVYDPSPHAVFEFRDETEHIKTNSGRHVKRKTTLAGKSTPRQPSRRQLSPQAETRSPIDDPDPSSPLEGSSLAMLDTAAMPWMDGIFDSYPDQQWDLTPDSAVLWNAAAQTWGPYADSPGQVSAEFHVPNSGRLCSSSPQTVSDRVLAQHYTQNLASKYSSKGQSWNNHT
ncbi:hypothetical protein ACJZ2D_016233 [Fusarium nematophilum]